MVKANTLTPDVHRSGPLSRRPDFGAGRRWRVPRFGGLLRSLPHHSTAILEIRLNEVRFLLDSEASADGALHALLGFYGYYEREVSSETLVAFVDEILRHDARDIPDGNGQTALDLAERWVAHGKHPNYEPVMERLRALHARSGS